MHQAINYFSSYVIGIFVLIFGDCSFCWLPAVQVYKCSNALKFPFVCIGRSGAVTAYKTAETDESFYGAVL